MCHRSARSGRRFDMVVVKRWSFRRTVDSHPSHVQTLRNHCNTLWVLAWVFFLECPFPPPLRPPTPAPVRYGKWGAGGGGMSTYGPLWQIVGVGKDGRTDRCTACLRTHTHTLIPDKYIRNIDHSAQIIIVTYENKPGLVSTHKSNMLITVYIEITS